MVAGRSGLEELNRRGSFRLLSAIPAIVRFFALLVGIVAGIVTTIVVLTDGDESRSRNSQPTIVLPTAPTVDPDLSILPDFLVSDIRPCVIQPTISSDPRDVVARLVLNFEIINRGNLVFEPNELFIEAVSDHGLGGRISEYLGEDSWAYDHVRMDWASNDIHVDLQLKSAHLGKLHRFVVTVDSTGIGSGSQVHELDESNNQTVVLVPLPLKPPGSDDWVTLPCNAPAVTKSEEENDENGHST